jgi:predicted metal-dependent enzyme (double-stranded beta helix superfamily)
MDAHHGGTDPRLRAFLIDLESLVRSSSHGRDVVLAVKDRLSRFLRERPELPASCVSPVKDYYARHLLYRDPHQRFEVVVMAWAPGQTTPVHDHSGIWCVEGVFTGVIDVTRYDIRENLAADLVRMEQLEVIHAGLGECGALIPPVEFHRISNPYDALAVTVHIYGGMMRSCRTFTPRDGQCWDVALRELSFSHPEPAIAPLTA